MNELTQNRRYDLDWLRVIAFAILIWFHAAIIFIPGGLPLIQNGETSAMLDWFVAISHQFRLALLFLVSGCGVAYARRRRVGLTFVRERSVRLLVPLVFGIFVLVPPMVYLEKLHIGSVNVGFDEFYPAFFTEGIYPVGNLSWHHLWFIAYLYLFCMLGLFWFERLSNLDGRWRNELTRYGRGGGIFLLIIPLSVVEIALRAAFPGFRDLIHDWASFLHWFLIFVAGYVIATDQRVLANIAARIWQSCGLAMTSGIVLFTVFYDDGFHLDLNEDWVVMKYLALCIVRMTFVWSVLLLCIGLAGRYLCHGGRVLRYLNEAVYPCFLLHLTVIVALGYWVTPWNLTIVWKYNIVTWGTVVVVLLVHHWLICPFDTMRFLFGLKPQARNVNDVADVSS